MKAPMQWIESYVDIPVDGEQYAQKMIMIGNGVEGIEQLGAEVSGVVVDRVLTCEDHPDSDHLHDLQATSLFQEEQQQELILTE